MKTINKDELFRNLSGFLKSKGIELKEGSYSRRIEKGCGLLADVVNATQHAAKRAKAEVNKKLGQLRESIHEATAPKAAHSRPASSRPNPRPKVRRRKHAAAPGRPGRRK